MDIDITQVIYIKLNVISCKKWSPLTQSIKKQKIFYSNQFFKIFYFFIFQGLIHEINWFKIFYSMKSPGHLFLFNNKNSKTCLYFMNQPGKLDSLYIYLEKILRSWKNHSLFIFPNNFSYTQLAFVFVLQEDFYNVPDHIGAFCFCFSLLQKDFCIVYERIDAF